LQPARRLVIRITAMAVPARLEWPRLRVAHVDGFPDARGNAVQENVSDGLHVLGGEGPQDPPGARDLRLEGHSIPLK
jgi:hypothetical protein